MQEIVRLPSMSQFRAVRKCMARTRLVAVCLGAVTLSWAQNSKPASPPAHAPKPASQAAANPLPPVQIDGGAVLHQLNELISWYRHATTGIPSVGMPSDAIYQDNAQNIAAEAVRLGF